LREDRKMTQNGGLGGERQGKARKVNEERTDEDRIESEMVGCRVGRRGERL
jgi:hypothetical protein